MTRVLSGIKPTGTKHLGNILGSIQPFAAYLNDYDCFYFVADLHALTILPDPRELTKNTYETAAMLIAAGLTMDKLTLFVQSQVGSYHSELSYLLSCFASHGELTRMHQFKVKSAQGQPISGALLTYPILQAADVLLYDADIVPIGADQIQHIELTRDLAERANNRYGNIFTVPKRVEPLVASRIMDLADPTNKMSTTSGNPRGTLYITDTKDQLVKKIKSAVTDTGEEIITRSDKPGISNLLEILSAVTGTSIAELETKYQGVGYGQFKLDVAEAVVSYMMPIQTTYNELIKDPLALKDLLKANGEKAEAIAIAKLLKVKASMGLIF